MNLRVLGSSSKGNGYILSNGEESLIIECGVPFSDVYFYERVSSVVGCLVSHEHKDHCKYYEDYLSSCINVYSSKGTNDVLRDRLRQKNLDRFIYDLKADSVYLIGGFKVLPFEVVHDVREPFAYVIYHKDMGTLLFVTDTRLIPRFYEGVNHLLIECNYDYMTLNSNVGSNRTPQSLAKRVMLSHLGLDNCITYLEQIDRSDLENIVLLHLSDGHSNSGYMKKTISDKFGLNCVVADKGVFLEL